ncbi:MAG: septum formation initiator family protein [Treponema sp.]|jgi:cell division protein FtsL|nr:septum formation initiator family protein [Treponema sp.]
MKYIWIYIVVITIPLCLGFNAWQSVRYAEVSREIKQLEKTQTEWIENNKRLIAGIAMLSSSERIEKIAKNELGLVKKTPEEIMQIRIEGIKRTDG